MEMHKTSEEMLTHIRQHVTRWPAGKQDIAAECQGMSDITDQEKKWFLDSLPEGIYDTPEDVLKALQMKQMA
jgi:hypothetical protein